MFLKVLLFIFIFIIFIFCYLMYFYRDYIFTDNYGVFCIYGKMGSGKSTYIQREIVKWVNSGWKIFCNFEMSFSSRFDPADLGKKVFPENSLILIDEAGTIWDNRAWKNTSQEFIDYLRLARHYKNRIVFLSQSNDLDKKIRDMSKGIYLQKKKFLWSVLYRVDKNLTVDNGKDQAGNSGGQIIEAYNIVPWWVPKSRIIFFIPRWAWLFNSFEIYKAKSYFGYEPIIDDLDFLKKETYKKHKHDYFKSVLSSDWYKFSKTITNFASSVVNLAYKVDFFLFDYLPLKAETVLESLKNRFKKGV